MLARRYLSLVLLAFCTVAGPVFAATPGDAIVPGYHGGPDRSGHYILPGLTWDRAARVHLDPAFDGRVQGHVYAQPLYWKPPGARSGLLIVATESNLVYALDAATGREVWHREVGAPVARSALPCGNIDPLGITGTPVLDEGRGAVYLDAMVDEHGTPQHLVFGLSLKDGSVLPGWPVNIASGLRAKGAAFNVPVQGQRSALLLLGDRLYVPFGGHFGDCGDYHGWVVGLRVDRPEVIAAWTTRARKGGIWAPGGISSDGQSLFVATGNTEGARTWGDGEAVLRLAPDLHHSTDARDFFAPTNWRQLDDEDADLGGSNPLPLDLPGDRGAASLLLALGKDGNAYLLDRRNLGGIGGSLLVQRVSTRSIITAPATYPGREGVFRRFPEPRRFLPWADGRLRADRNRDQRRTATAHGLVCAAGRPRRSDRHHDGRQRQSHCLGRWGGGG